jgi:hypothetical protein
MFNVMPKGSGKTELGRLLMGIGGAEQDADYRKEWIADLQALIPSLSRYEFGGSNIGDILSFLTGYTNPDTEGVEQKAFAPKWTDYIGGLNNTIKALFMLWAGGSGVAEIFHGDILGGDFVTSKGANTVLNVIKALGADTTGQGKTWITQAVKHELPWIIGDLGAKGYRHGGIIPETGIYQMHKGEVYNPAMGGNYGSAAMNKNNNTNTYIFVPYNTSEEEQDRLVREVVKPRLQEMSENEQFLYDNAIIKTNTGT